MAKTKRPKLTKSAAGAARPEKKPYELRGDGGLILRIQPTGRKTFYAEHGRAKRKRIGDAEVITFKQAEYRARQILNEAYEFGDVLHDEPKKSTLSGFIEEVYTPWLRANRRRPEATLADLKRNFYHLYKKRVSDITRDDLDNFVSARHKAGSSPSTTRRSLNNLQRVMRLAGEKKYVRSSPFKGWAAPKPDDLGSPRYLHPDEERRLREALCERDDKARRERWRANDWRRERGYDLLPEFGEREFPDHLHPMVLVSLNTGLRYGELSALEWSAVDLNRNVLTVTGKTAKGAKTRHIPLNAEAADVLTRWRGERPKRGLVFANQDSTRIGSVKTAWLAVLGNASIENFRWHDLRHTFASKLVQRSVSLAIVRDLLGHGDFKLTLRYAHLKDEQKTAAVAALNGDS